MRIIGKSLVLFLICGLVYVTALCVQAAPSALTETNDNIAVQGFAYGSSPNMEINTTVIPTNRTYVTGDDSTEAAAEWDKVHQKGFVETLKGYMGRIKTFLIDFHF